LKIEYLIDGRDKNYLTGKNNLIGKGAEP